MKVTLNEDIDKDRELVAVIGGGGEGLFLKGQEHNTLYVSDFPTTNSNPGSLQDRLDESSERKPVYKGDTIKIKL